MLLRSRNWIVLRRLIKFITPMIYLGNSEFHERRKLLITLFVLRNMHRYSNSFELLSSTASRSNDVNLRLVLRADKRIAMAKFVVLIFLSRSVSR